MFRLAILSSVSHFMLCQTFHVVSAILYICQSFYALGQPFYHVSAVFFLYQPFRGLPAILSCVCHFLLCQSLYFSVSHYIYIYIYIKSFLLTFLLLCVLKVYYLDNLLSNVPVLAGTPHCQIFTSDIIDSISNLDREVSRDGSVTFSKLPVSKTFFLPAFSNFCHFIVKTV
jgi:hypothetical protein